MLRAFSLRDDRHSTKTSKTKDPKTSRTRAWIDSVTGNKSEDDDEEDEVSLMDVKQKIHHRCGRHTQGTCRGSNNNTRRRSLVVLDVPADATLVLRQDPKRRSVQMQTMTDPQTIQQMLNKLCLEHRAGLSSKKGGSMAGPCPFEEKTRTPMAASPASMARSYRSHISQPHPPPPHMTPRASSLRSPLVSLKRDLFRKQPHPLVRAPTATASVASRWYRDSDSSGSSSSLSSASSHSSTHLHHGRAGLHADKPGRLATHDDTTRWIH